jgi:hypothetical protein
MTADVYHTLFDNDQINKSKFTSKKLLNQFDQISGKDAKEMLNPANETETILKDPRMTQWMIQNGMDTSPAMMEQMIYNNTVPNIRKITQSDPTNTSGTRLKKYIGSDIDWQDSTTRRMERSDFINPEETRLPQSVGSSGKGTIPAENSTNTRKFYEQNASKYLNNYQETDRIHVGRGIHADSGSTMNLNYSLGADVLLRNYNPGLQRQIVEYSPNYNNIDLSNLKSNTLDSRGEYMHKSREQRIESTQLEKFSSELLQNSVAPRTLKSILSENNFTENGRDLSDVLEYNQKFLSTPTPKLIQGTPRDSISTHDTSDKTIENKQNNIIKGMSLKQMISRVDSEYIQHPERSKNMNTTIMIESGIRKKSNDLVRNNAENTLYPRKLSSDVNAFVPLKSHGGGQPKTQSMSTLTQDTKNIFTIEPTREKNYGHAYEIQKTEHNIKREINNGEISQHGKKIMQSEPSISDYLSTNERSKRNRPIISIENEGVRVKHAKESGNQNAEITSNKFARKTDIVTQVSTGITRTNQPANDLPGENTRSKKKATIYNVMLI